ncbi:MAG: RloB family protein [Candidatus Omnitrophota bacterium]
MATDSLYSTEKNRSLERKSGNRGKPPESFLIFCEGTKTEPNYFRAFRVSSANVKVVGCGMNTLSLVEEAIRVKRNYMKDGRIHDHVWCVFDRDDFPLENFNAAFDLAETEGIKIAYSNEAFELWYLLHFEYLDIATDRHEYTKILSRHLNSEYRKNCTTMYDELLQRQADAIINAEKLLNSYAPLNPGTNNPSTTVHLLVQELNKFISKD